MNTRPSIITRHSSDLLNEACKCHSQLISHPLPQKCAELAPTCVHAAAIHESPTAPCQVLLETQMLDLLHADVHAAINSMEAVTSDG